MPTLARPARFQRPPPKWSRALLAAPPEAFSARWVRLVMRRGRRAERAEGAALSRGTRFVRRWPRAVLPARAAEAEDRELIAAGGESRRAERAACAAPRPGASAARLGVAAARLGVAGARPASRARRLDG